MSDTAVTIALYSGLGLITAVVIFAAAFWFASAAKKGSVRFKWMQRRERGGRTDERSNAPSQHPKREEAPR